MKKKKKDRVKPLVPHIIGIYPNRVVHMSVPYGIDKRSPEFLEARRWQKNLARKISESY